jgi:hypothetical protein
MAAWSCDAYAWKDEARCQPQLTGQKIEDIFISMKKNK